MVDTCLSIYAVILFTYRYGAYQIMNHSGKVLRYGNLINNYGYDDWAPFTIDVPRADFGRGNKITVTITRATGYGSKETINLNLYYK